MLIFVLLGLSSAITTEECIAKLSTYTLDGPCFSLLLSKALGYAMVSASFMLKLPQILKIYKNNSVQGISLTSFYLETLSFSILAAYSVHRQQPFSTYGEHAIISAQCLIQIVTYWMIAKTNTTHRLIVSFLLIFCWFVPLFGELVPELFWQYVPIYCLLLNLVVKLSQIKTNYQNHSTGNLSFITSFLNFAGTISRVFTTITELNDPFLLLSYVSGAALNAIIMFQFVIYWTVKPKEE